MLTSTIVGGLSLAPGVALAQTMCAAGRDAAASRPTSAATAPACECIFNGSVNLGRHVAAAAAVRLREQPVTGLRCPSMPGERGTDRVRGHGIGQLGLPATAGATAAEAVAAG